MERRFEGQVFCTCKNNGVQVLVPELVVHNFRRHNMIFNALENVLKTRDDRSLINEVLNQALPAFPIFTFVNSERLEKEPWITGSHKLYGALCLYIEQHGGRLKNQGVYVPFSNGYQFTRIDIFADELIYVTMDEDFIETFGISQEDLLILDPPDFDH